MKRRAVRNPDAEIEQLQQRIRLERMALTLSLQASQQAFRARLGSPAMLLTAAGAGFALGRIARNDDPGSASVRTRRWALMIQVARTAIRLASSGPVLRLARIFARLAMGREDRTSSVLH